MNSDHDKKQEPGAETMQSETVQSVEEKVAVPKICPILRDTCIKEGCEFWTALQMVRVSGPLKVPKPETQWMCLFAALVFIESTPKATVQMGPNMPRLNM